MSAISVLEMCARSIVYCAVLERMAGPLDDLRNVWSPS